MNIFSENGVQNLDKDDLKICLEAIKGKKEEKINEEIDTLINIFGNNINKFKYDKNSIIKSMIILSRKEDIYKLAIGISILIEKLQLIKGNFWRKAQKIIEDLENKNDNNEKETLENSINKLEEENIDIKILKDKNTKNNYLNILLLLKEQPEAIDFIVKRSDADCHNIQEFIGENDNAFLNSNDILDLEKCVEFKMKLGDENDFKNKEYKDLIMFFKQLVEKIENNNNISNKILEIKNNNNSLNIGTSKSLNEKNIVLFFTFEKNNEKHNKQLFINANENETFGNIIKHLKEKYSWIELIKNITYSYNNKRIDDFSVQIKNLNIRDGSNIIIRI